MTFKGNIGLIGAREGSKRIPNKNISLLGRFPLIAYSIFISRASYFIDETFVSTDSNEIAKISYEYNANIITRPEELAQDNSSDYDWIVHFIREYKNQKGIYPKNIVLLRPTTPLRKTAILDTIISSFDDKNDSLRSIERASEAVEKHFKLKENILKPICKHVKLEDTNNPNQLFEPSYKANGYCDILKTEYILKNGNLYGKNIQGYVTEQTIEIDDKKDLEYAQYIMRGKDETY